MLYFFFQENNQTPVSKGSTNPTPRASSFSSTRPDMFQRPPSQSTSTKARPGSSIASAILTSENYKKGVVDSTFTRIPENMDQNSDNDMKVRFGGEDWEDVNYLMIKLIAY